MYSSTRSTLPPRAALNGLGLKAKEAARPRPGLDGTLIELLHVRISQI